MLESTCRSFMARSPLSSKACSGLTSNIITFASPPAAMKAPSSEPNGKHLPISSARTLATCCNSRDTYFDRFHRPLRRTLPRQAREHGVPRRHVVARMDHHVLRCHAKIPHPSLQRRAFVHSLASGEFKATFGDPDAGRGDPDRRLQLFRHAGQVLPCRSLGILPDARDLRLE